MIRLKKEKNTLGNDCRLAFHSVDICLRDAVGGSLPQEQQGSEKERNHS